MLGASGLWSCARTHLKKDLMGWPTNTVGESIKRLFVVNPRHIRFFYLNRQFSIIISFMRTKSHRKQKYDSFFNPLFFFLKGRCLNILWIWWFSPLESMSSFYVVRRRVIGRCFFGVFFHIYCLLFLVVGMLLFLWANQAVFRFFNDFLK